MKMSYGKLLIAIAVFGVCLGAAFAAGTVYGRHSTPGSASAASIGTTNNLASGSTGTSGSSRARSTAESSTAPAGTSQAGSAPGGGQGFFGGFGGRPLQAKVDSVNGQQLQVTIGTGTPTAITLDGQTTYASSVTAEKSALMNGAPVYVMTAAASDGTLTAQSVIVLPASQARTATQTPGGTGSQTTGGQTGTGATGGQGVGGGGRGFGGANRGVDGTVAAVNGNQLQVTLANGSTTTLTLNDQTTYATTKQADQSAVTSGSTALITVSRGTSGLTAQSVIVLPAGAQTN